MVKTLLKFIGSVVVIILIGAILYCIVKERYSTEIIGKFQDSSFEKNISQITNEFVHLEYNGKTESIFSSSLSTMLHFIIIFLLSIIIGSTLGVLIGLSRRLNLLTEHFINFFRVLPSIVFITVFKYQLKLGENHIYYVGVIASIWPIIINTRSGVSKNISTLEYSIKQLNLPRLKKLYVYILPKAFPGMWDGIKISLGISFLITITCEYITTSLGGLGETLNYFEETPGYILHSIISVLWIGLVGICITTLFDLAESKILWLNKNIQTGNVK